MPSAPSRYRSLDAARGLASLAVAAFHCWNTLVAPGRSLLGDAVLAGWAGVYVFFPISGYCILAAVEAPRSRTLGRFLHRRWRRIFPPYWASMALTLAVALAALPWNRGSLGDLARPAWQWLSLLTLTQGLTGARDINIVYWSLCYEEQFYLVMAAAMLLGPRARRAALLAVSLLGAWWRLAPGAPHPEGLFLERWLEFAVGMAVYDFAEGGLRRGFAAALLGLAAATAWGARDGNLAISLGAALALLALRPLDGRLASSRLGAALGALGAMSYSLYLVHVPIGGRVVNLARRLVGDAPSSVSVVAIGALALAVSLAAAALFHRLVERRFVG